MTTTIVIKGGRVIDPASDLDATADVVVENGRILAIETVPVSKDAHDNVIDAEGCIVAPGLIDPHVHFRDPHPLHDETTASGIRSAINGGFTSVACMPNTDPPLDSAVMIDTIRERARRTGKARVYVVGCATLGRQGAQPAAIDAMATAGAVGFSDDGNGIADSNVCARVMRNVKKTGRALMQHCQDESLTSGGVMNAGVLATRLGLGGWPAAAEEAMLERDIRLNRDIGCRYHAQHLSSAGSVELIRLARAEGLPISAEASPHHLLLTEDACAGYDPMTKMNPPLRAHADLEALRQGVADGTITVLATDHAPHPLHTKQTDFTSASFGIVGLECALPLYAKALIETGVLNWPSLLSMMTIQPARLLGLDRVGLGAMKADGPADLTVIDPECQWTISAAEFAGRGRNCPFDGWSVTARALTTIVGGAVTCLRSSDRYRGPAVQATLLDH
jgi:dihydroorotase